MKLQMDSIVQALSETATDLGKAAAQWGVNVRDQIMRAIEVIVQDIVRYGRFNMDGSGNSQWVDFGRCRFSIEPGMSTYSSKTCVWCCNCVNNVNAVRTYLAWRLDCRS
jgi:hypothetical protein